MEHLGLDDISLTLPNDVVRFVWMHIIHIMVVCSTETYREERLI